MKTPPFDDPNDVARDALKGCLALLSIGCAAAALIVMGIIHLVKG